MARSPAIWGRRRWRRDAGILVADGEGYAASGAEVSGVLSGDEVLISGWERGRCVFL